MSRALFCALDKAVTMTDVVVASLWSARQYRY